jgi:predicted dehydrogenase
VSLVNGSNSPGRGNPATHPVRLGPIVNRSGSRDVLSVAVIGLGYWGPNRVRAFTEIPDVAVSYICDTDPGRLEAAERRYPLARPTSDFREILEDPAVDAVVIATPASSHFDLATQTLERGKHAFVEKPLAATSEEAAELAESAADQGLVLMCGHTFLYSPPVRKVKQLLDAGELGELYFISSRRVNLGPYRSDVSVISDLGPHDFSILLYWLGQSAAWVSAVGRDVISQGIADVAFVDISFPDGLLSHVELSWLAPSKLRQTVIVGSEKMLVYEDGQAEPVRIFDSGIEYRDPESYGEYHLSYRTGDIVSPRVDSTEPIVGELGDFVDAIATSSPPESSPWLAVEAIRLVEAAESSMADCGHRVSVGAAHAELT